jgi:hypothetical protein
MAKLRDGQRGAVSLFVVLFAILLLVTFTVGFMRIMIGDQQQATTDDLSRSAYDSAQAGVEDAKRALLRIQNICNSGSASDCSNAKKDISTTCNKVMVGLYAASGVTIGDAEVKIQNDNNTNRLDQAYTCVTANLTPNDYLGSLAKNKSVVIPLKGTNSFNKVKIEWFTSKDIGSNSYNTSGGFYDVSLLDSSAPFTLTSGAPLLSSWPANRPPIMRAQLMQFNASIGFKLDDLNEFNNSNTLFLYPRLNGSTTKSSTYDNREVFTYDNRYSNQSNSSSKPSPVKCEQSVAVGKYACNVTITLPNIGSVDNRVAYMRLASLYNKANYRVTLMNGSTLVKFDSVQSEVDSTGRANDYFRRVNARVELSDINFPYPDGAVDVTGSFCKSFSVTNRTGGTWGYEPDDGVSCTP